MILHVLFAKTLRSGRLSVVYDDGLTETYGDGSGAPVVVRLSRKAALRIALEPSLGLGEAYMEGDLVFEKGDLWDLLSLVGRNLPERPRIRHPFLAGVKNALVRRLRQVNDRRAARRNVAHHYDLAADLYRRFLDADMQYSCAYFAKPGMSLEEAQAAKKAHLAAKLRLRPGHRVLDIGSGWGGLGLSLARDYGAKVTGITLSEEQLALANRRAAAEDLSDRARFALSDYRDVRGAFDRIISVGMFEHVGSPNYVGFFQQIERLLTDDGVAVVHAIGRMEPPGTTDPFIRKYIFPGGYIPSLSQVTAAVEKAGLWITDIEILRLHYAETLRCWRARFQADRAAIAALYDERFCRMFEFYLAVGELSFRTGTTMVFQLQLTRRMDALPIVRDYMFEEERAPAWIEPAAHRQDGRRPQPSPPLRNPRERATPNASANATAPDASSSPNEIMSSAPISDTRTIIPPSRQAGKHKGAG
ncbi:SAM-dependent methyltransferase [Phenylobacterium montanum]|uniref:Class I SAM-dependent methyltransferase n=1 Tax=Phenylobacterium montanum TaxID=2823693 RepID=A0A975IWF0_9CAUL|nr:class I SAM-dependent methyltransferase [Caulobacter sp. S6]